MSKIEIVERSSGFWLVDDTGIVDHNHPQMDHGPFETLEEAQNELEQIEVWNEVLNEHGINDKTDGKV